MYVCIKCGSPHVESLSWVDLNNGEIDVEDETGEYFCRDCGTPTDVQYLEEKENEEDNS